MALAEPVAPDSVLAEPVLAEPVLAEPVLAEPVLAAPALAAPALAAPALAEPVPPDPVLAEPVLADPLSAAPAPAAGGVLSVGLEPVSPEVGGLDAGDTGGVEELPLTGVVAVAVTWGLAVLDGWAELGWHGVPVPWAVCLAPDALELAFAEAVVLALPVAVEVALAVAVSVAVAVPVAVAVVLSPGLLLVLPVGGLLAEFAGDALGGVTDLADLADSALVDDGETGGHAVPRALLWAAEVPPWLTPPAGAPFWVADPFRLGVPSPVLELEIPTAVPSWTKA